MRLLDSTLHNDRNVSIAIITERRKKKTFWECLYRYEWWTISGSSRYLGSDSNSLRTTQIITSKVSTWNSNSILRILSLLWCPRKKLFRSQICDKASNTHGEKKWKLLLNTFENITVNHTPLNGDITFCLYSSSSVLFFNHFNLFWL